MFRLSLRLRRYLLPPILIGILITSTIIILNNNFRNVFYDYQITFHGLPGRYLSTKTPNESYCNFQYGLPEELLYEETDVTFPHEQQSKSRYRILENIIEAKWDKAIPQVTYATHVTADFVNYLAEIVRFWEGPISVAAFVPDFDADLTIRQLNQLCSCVPEMSRVSVHFIFPLNLPPYLQNHQDKLTCEISDSSKLATFRSNNQMSYPINVCRNIARNLAQTHYVMVSDIQLVPSNGLATKFVQMLKSSAQIKLPKSPSHVFVVPVFEVEAFDVIPRTKEELLMMVKQERAVYFHRHVCSHCQKFPGLKTWLETNINIIKPFVSVKREYPFHRWEPVYIGSKNEPLYTEDLSWEGLQDKMTQMLEMCLIGYQFVVLDGGFLVHWPGVKRKLHRTQQIIQNYWRAPYEKNNSETYNRVKKKLLQYYKENPKCKL